MPNPIRTAHGTGADSILRVEQPPLDEEAPLNAEDTARGLAERLRRGRPFALHNEAAKGRKPSLCVMGVPLETADPRYRRAARKARSWTQRRIRELATAHGGTVGAGPCSALVSAGLAVAASRVLYELAAETLDPKLFRDAAALADSARMQELFAEGLAAREAAAKPKGEPSWRARILGAAKEGEKP